MGPVQGQHGSVLWSLRNFVFRRSWHDETLSNDLHYSLWMSLKLHVFVVRWAYMGIYMGIRAWTIIESRKSAVPRASESSPSRVPWDSTKKWLNWRLGGAWRCLEMLRWPSIWSEGSDFRQNAGFQRCHNLSQPVTCPSPCFAHCRGEMRLWGLGQPHIGWSSFS